jgi:hypothetical protein
MTQIRIKYCYYSFLYLKDDPQPVVCRLDASRKLGGKFGVIVKMG